jgi:hypothetical protein
MRHEGSTSAHPTELALHDAAMNKNRTILTPTHHDEECFIP